MGFSLKGKNNQMTTDDFHKEAGFSLVELMIVVAVVAILSAIAINSFYGIVRRSKASEVFKNLSTIRSGQEAYRAENGIYVAVGPWPIATPPASGVLWEDPAASPAVVENTNFKVIGFAVDGVVRYSYRVTVAVAPSYYTATAKGDLDDDNIDALYILANDPAQANMNNAGDKPFEVYPKIILVAQDATYDDY